MGADRRKIAEKRNHRNVTETRLLWLMSRVVRPLAIGGRVRSLFLFFIGTLSVSWVLLDSEVFMGADRLGSRFHPVTKR